jgi:hypothetical protein
VRSTGNQRGLTLIDLLAAMAVFMLVFMAVLAAYVHGTALSAHSASLVMLQDGLRVALDMLERDLRAIGLGVPQGVEIGGSAVWTPAVFHASPTEIGFRGEIDGGNAMLTCTPSSTNSNCDLDLLRVDTTRRYEELNCEQPDDPGVALELVLVAGDGTWEATTCGGVNVSDSSIDVAAVTDGAFAASTSELLSIEQVYYRYVARAVPPYGSLERHVRYGNQPDDTFPPSPADWTIVMDHLTDFWMEYRDFSDNVLVGDPLSAAQRESVASIVFLMEGYDRAGPQGKVQLVEVESRVRIRNAGL